MRITCIWKQMTQVVSPCYQPANKKQQKSSARDGKGYSSCAHDLDFSWPWSSSTTFLITRLISLTWYSEDRNSSSFVVMPTGDEFVLLGNPNLLEDFLVALSNRHLPHFPSWAVGFGQPIRSTSRSLLCRLLHRHVHGAWRQTTRTTTNKTLAARLKTFI